MIAGAALREALRRAGERPLVIGDAGTWTARDLDAAIDGLARSLQRAAPATATIGLWFTNSVYALIAHMAVQRAGLTRLSVDPAAAPPEAGAIFNAGNCHLVLADPQHAPAVSGDVLAYGAEAGRRADGGAEPVEVARDQTEYLFPRSVFSGTLLAVPISFGNWAAYVDLNAGMWRDGGYGSPVRADDVFLTCQQLMHGTGFAGTVPFLYLGLPQVILPSFDPGSVLAAVERHGATCSFMVPGMVTRLANAQRGTPRGLRRIVYGGAPFPAGELVAAIAATGSELTQIYGRLEGGWPLTTLTPADHAKIAAGATELASSCGRAVPGLEIGIRPLPGYEELGELRVRSDLVSPAFRDPDGWCGLGDLASVDASGYYRLHGRIDGMINTGAYHVYPREVEEAIRQTLPVREVSVSAEPDERWGQAVTATLTWPAGVRPPGETELRNLLKRRLAPYKIPTRYHHRA